MESQNNKNSNNHNSEQSANSESNDNNSQDSSFETPNTDPQILSSPAEDSNYYRSFLEQLLNLLCNEDQETVARLVSIIRSGASHQDILAVISQVQNGHNHIEGNACTPSVFLLSSSYDAVVSAIVD
ncbi:hypothetical protein BDV29DRAFT_156535 [Aspergillus leporis]|uniref:Uncharacterized protein n=1 Tax=Aspergillus leporis TaxID=41062 RepID=A0A5N5X179_9EURO|nr:hypothetical protein BDV29DRAFT_156535 [Aspergillus leporis]